MLNGKVALVTGASRGIGRAVAIELAKNGAAVIINYCGNQEKAKEVQNTIESFGGKAVCYHCDVADFEESKNMVEEVINQFGSLDILVNNAGITRDNLLVRMSEEEFDSVISTNLKGSFHMIRFASRQMMRQRSGRIVNISSVSGVIGNAGQANYSASKAGVIGLTKSAARELSSRNITVNAIAPGFIETDMTGQLKEEVRTNVCKQIPLGRFGAVEDIAHMAVFLAGEKSGYITGQVICVDGGMAM